MNSNGNDRKRDTSPTVVAPVPNTSADLLVYRSVDSEGNVMFHFKIARRNRNGDGYYQTFRIDSGIWDVLFGLHYLCSKMALVPECSTRVELKELGRRLGLMIAEMAVGKPANGNAQSNPQQTNGLTTAFGPA